jgi:hypothetical protein
MRVVARARPTPRFRYAGRTYNRFISQIRDDNGRAPTTPAAVLPTLARSKLPRGGTYGFGNDRSSSAKFSKQTGSPTAVAYSRNRRRAVPAARFEATGTNRIRAPDVGTEPRCWVRVRPPQEPYPRWDLGSAFIRISREDGHPRFGSRLNTYPDFYGLDDSPRRTEVEPRVTRVIRNHDSCYSQLPVVESASRLTAGSSFILSSGPRRPPEHAPAVRPSSTPRKHKHDE